MNTKPHTEAELMLAAAQALIARDAFALERLERHTETWLGGEDERAARRHLLRAMIEAAYMLEDEPSEVEAQAD